MTKCTNTILIADDDPDYLMLFSVLLKQAGYEVFQAQGMREAEAFLEQNEPILVVFDLMMEQHDSGFVLAYKSKKLYPNVPVIICTSVAAETGIDFSSKNDWVKADLFLEKGKATSILAEEVNRLLKK